MTLDIVNGKSILGELPELASFLLKHSISIPATSCDDLHGSLENIIFSQKLDQEELSFAVVTFTWKNNASTICVLPIVEGMVHLVNLLPSNKNIKKKL